ncbi:MAG: imidazole glycerol phosphate synthase subunit HisH, partial [Acetobacter sp.]|nr:imidazole glycerol phosphate synthase subunit HisH [Acetobacter sp.]
ELNLHKPDHPLVQGLGKSPHGYFVHSYALRNTSSDVLVATTEYGGEVPAIVCRGNVAGTQFHVEKSQKVGLKILANFLSWCPQKSLQESLIYKH